MPHNGKVVGVLAPHPRPGNKAVWNPAMSTEVDRLVSTQTTRFMKKRNLPKGEKAVYTRLVVDLIPNKAVN